MEGVNSTRVCPNSGEWDGNGGIYKSRNFAIFLCALIQFIKFIYMYHVVKHFCFLDYFFKVFRFFPVDAKVSIIFLILYCSIFSWT